MSANILHRLPWGEILELLDELRDSGSDREEALDACTAFLDQLLPLDLLVSGPAGMALETIDGPVIRAALGLAWTLAADEERRAARKARRAARREARG